MPTTRLKSTTEAVKGGIQKMPAEKAVANIEGWEDYLSKHDHEGVKKVVADLGKLKKLLKGGEIDSAAVSKLLTTIGKDTVKVAGDEKNANAQHIKELGEALAETAKA